VVPGPVQRAISEKPPEDVAWAVIQFINGPLAENPHRVGGELRGGYLKGIHSAHLGSFRIQYMISEEDRTVTLRRVAHHSAIYGLP
jgi:mRNA interferase RelE/StbE